MNFLHNLEGGHPENEEYEYYDEEEEEDAEVEEDVDQIWEK